MTTALAPPTQDEFLLRHAEALSFPSLSGYLLWCRKNGLGTAPDKTDEELERECLLAADTLRPGRPHPGSSHTPGRARLVDRAYRGEIPPDERYPLNRKLIDLFAASGEDAGRRDALYRLLKQVERRSDLLGIKAGILHWTRAGGNNYEDALGQLARHHADWLRPVEEWRTDQLNTKAQFRSLTRHLLARYDVPPFMDTAFFQGDDPMAHREQEWFKHVGLGTNIRRAETPIKLTRRMAHVFQDAPPNWLIVRAMRWAQFYGVGGYGNMVREILDTQLKYFQQDEPFWESVVRFLANHSMLERSYVGPIIDFIHYQKFVPQQVPGPNGQPIEGPPAQPNFSMKSRSIAKLLRQVEEWHDDLNAADYKLGENETWESSGLREFELEEEDEFSGQRITWSIRELRTALDLKTEGYFMRHCIPSYIGRCNKGACSVWSLQMTYPDQLPQRVLTISVKNSEKTVGDHRGKYNMHPYDNKRTAPRLWKDQPYLYYLRESPRILRLWMEREGLKHD